MQNSRRAGKSAAAFRTISEVAGDLDVPPHVLRFWETKFTQIKPLKRGGGRRYYRPEDIVLLRNIRELLYGEGYTIKGVQRLLRDGLVKLDEASPKVAAAGTTEAVPQQVSLLDDMDLPDGRKLGLHRHRCHLTPLPDLWAAPLQHRRQWKICSKF